MGEPERNDRQGAANRASDPECEIQKACSAHVKVKPAGGVAAIRPTAIQKRIPIMRYWPEQAGSF